MENHDVDEQIFGKQKWLQKSRQAHCQQPRDAVEVGGTVDGQNPAPPIMMIIPLFIGF